MDDGIAFKYKKSNQHFSVTFCEKNNEQKKIPRTVGLNERETRLELATLSLEG
jgi:hypothetical protein